MLLCALAGTMGEGSPTVVLPGFLGHAWAPLGVTSAMPHMVSGHQELQSYSEQEGSPAPR